MPYDDYSGAFSYGGQDYYEPLSFPSEGGVGGDTSPWKFNVIPDPDFPITAPPRAVLQTKGKIMYDVGKLLLIDEDKNKTEANFTNLSDIQTDGLVVTGEGVLYLKYFLDKKQVTIEFDARSKDDTTVWKRYIPENAFADPDNILDITDTKTPLALIHNNPTPPDDGTKADDYIVEQLASSNLQGSPICINGVIIDVFVPI